MAGQILPYQTQNKFVYNLTSLLLKKEEKTYLIDFVHWSFLFFAFVAFVNLKHKKENNYFFFLAFQILFLNAISNIGAEKKFIFLI